MHLRNIPLLFAMIRNIRAESINREMIGHSISRKIGPVTRCEINSYIEATLDNPVRYLDKENTAPPFYLSRLLYPMFRYFLVNRKLRLNLLRLVHGQQTIEWYGQFHEGDIIDVEMSIADITDSPAGEMINLKTVAKVDERVLAVANTFFIIRGKRRTQPRVKTSAAESREIFRKTIKTIKEQPLRYAEVSGDTNFIHTSPFLARLAGLPGTIMHGVCIAAMASNCLLDEVLGGDMTRMKGMSVRFAAPVIPGDEITLIGYESGEKGRVLFNAVNRHGRYVLKKGDYRFSA